MTVDNGQSRLDGAVVPHEPPVGVPRDRLSIDHVHTIGPRSDDREPPQRRRREVGEEAVRFELVRSRDDQQMPAVGIRSLPRVRAHERAPEHTRELAAPHARVELGPLSRDDEVPGEDDVAPPEQHRVGQHTPRLPRSACPGGRRGRIRAPRPPPLGREGEDGLDEGRARRRTRFPIAASDDEHDVGR